MSECWINDNAESEYSIRPFFAYPPSLAKAQKKLEKLRLSHNRGCREEAEKLFWMAKDNFRAAFDRKKAGPYYDMQFDDTGELSYSRSVGPYLPDMYAYEQQNAQKRFEGGTRSGSEARENFSWRNLFANFLSLPILVLLIWAIVDWVQASKLDKEKKDEKSAKNWAGAGKFIGALVLAVLGIYLSV